MSVVALLASQAENAAAPPGSRQHSTQCTCHRWRIRSLHHPPWERSDAGPGLPGRGNCWVFAASKPFCRRRGGAAIVVAERKHRAISGAVDGGCAPKRTPLCLPTISAPAVLRFGSGWLPQRRQKDAAAASGWRRRSPGLARSQGCAARGDIATDRGQTRAFGGADRKRCSAPGFALRPRARPASGQRQPLRHRHRNSRRWPGRLSPETEGRRPRPPQPRSSP